MTELQKEFEATGYTSWINADLYPDGKIYTQEYTQWLERQVLALRQPLVVGKSEQLRLKPKESQQTLVVGECQTVLNIRPTFSWLFRFESRIPRVSTVGVCQ